MVVSDKVGIRLKSLQIMNAPSKTFSVNVKLFLGELQAQIMLMPPPKPRDKSN